MTLKLKYHFDAAHRLETHTGLCRNLHGHRWEVLIEINSVIVKDMIVDFGKLKEILNQFDHSCILKDCEENKLLINTLKKMELKLILLRDTPTAENLSRIIHRKILDEIILSKDIIEKLKVEIWESPDASIEYSE